MSPRRSVRRCRAVHYLFSRIARFVAQSISTDEEHGFWQRVLAAAWGCIVLHIPIFSSAAGSTIVSDMRTVFFLATLSLVAVYSIAFGLIIGASLPKGSLVRHFVSGVLLPVFAYNIAGSLPGD